MNYITRLTVQNFYSIKNQVTVDFSASEYTTSHHEYRVFSSKSDPTSKLKVLYGTNASGKTSLVRALVYVAYLAATTDEKLAPAFKNIYSSPDDDSFIEVEFVVGVHKYRYKAVMQQRGSALHGFKNEILCVYKNDSWVQLINREERAFKDLEGKEIVGILFEHVSEFKSLLAESLTRVKDYQGLVRFFEYIVRNSNIKGIFGTSMQLEKSDELILAEVFFDEDHEPIEMFGSVEGLDFSLSEDDKKQFREFLYKFLQSVGIDICGASAELKKKATKDSELGLRFATNHLVDPNKDLPFNLESSGTKMFVKLIYNIFLAYKNKSILVMDELDSVLHPMLVPAINLLAIKNNVQVVYTTHNIHNMKYLYNDEILIVEKNNDHKTQIKDTKGHAGYKNFAKLYEEDLLGGLPNVTDLHLEFE